MHFASLKGIVLDIDGTLISLTKGVGEIYAELLGEMGIKSDAGALEQVARRAWGEFQPLYLNSGNEHRTTHERERAVWLSFVRRVLSEGGISNADDAAVLESVYNSFSSGRFRRIEPGVEEFARAARARGVSVFAATNNDARSKSVLVALGLADHLQGVYVAGDLGWKKPSSEYYVALQAATGFRANELLHIGNDFQLDVEIARRCGWEAILYDPKNRGPQPRVAHFDELTAMLGRGESP